MKDDLICGAAVVFAVFLTVYTYIHFCIPQHPHTLSVFYCAQCKVA